MCPLSLNENLTCYLSSPTQDSLYDSFPTSLRTEADVLLAEAEGIPIR